MLSAPNSLKENLTLYNPPYFFQARISPDPLIYDPDPVWYQDDPMNWTLGTVDWHQVDPLHHPVVRVVVIIIYIIVIIIGLIGNGGVLFVFSRSKRLKTVTNVFIMNLALADIWLALFSLPVQLHYQLTNRWVFGNIMCRIVFAAFAVPMYVSTISILLIAVDRYRQILHPLRPRFSSQTAVAFIALAVFVAVAISIPVVYYTKLFVHIDPQLNIHWSYCVELWPSDALPIRRGYSLLVFTAQFLLPLTITGYLYARIYARLKLRPTGLQKRTKKTNRLLIAIVANFCVCWLPWNLFSLIAELTPDTVGGSNFRLTDLLLKAFALGSSCVNPFLYCWLNDNFRNELSSLAIQLKIHRGGLAGGRSGALTPRVGLSGEQPSRQRGEARGNFLVVFSPRDMNTTMGLDRTDLLCTEGQTYLLEETVRTTMTD